MHLRLHYGKEKSLILDMRLVIHLEPSQLNPESCMLSTAVILSGNQMGTTSAILAHLCLCLGAQEGLSALQGALLDVRELGPGVAQAQAWAAAVVVVIDARPEGQLPLLRQQLLLPQLLLHRAKPTLLQVTLISTLNEMPGAPVHLGIVWLTFIHW